MSICLLQASYSRRHCDLIYKNYVENKGEQTDFKSRNQLEITKSVCSPLVENELYLITYGYVIPLSPHINS